MSKTSQKVFDLNIDLTVLRNIDANILLFPFVYWTKACFINSSSSTTSLTAKMTVNVFFNSSGIGSSLPFSHFLR